MTANVAGALYVCMGSREWPVVCCALAEAGAHWSDTIIWAKDRFTLGRADSQCQYEPIWYGWPEGTTCQWQGGRDQGDVWQIPASRRLAAAPHPEAAGHGRAGDHELQPPPAPRFLDPFCGAGTIGGAYALEGFRTGADLQRVLALALTDTLELENSVPRTRVLARLVAAAARVKETTRVGGAPAGAGGRRLAEDARCGIVSAACTGSRPA